jgi:hypothetical protein
MSEQLITADVYAVRAHNLSKNIDNKKHNNIA